MKVKVVKVKFIKVRELLRENRNLRASLEQDDIEIRRYKDHVTSLQQEFIEITDKYHQLEQSVKHQSACWMCKSNKECHQGESLPQSPNTMCAKFQFGYRKSEKHNSDCCDYKHGKVCWAQKGAPLCDPVCCPIR